MRRVNLTCVNFAGYCVTQRANDYRNTVFIEPKMVLSCLFGPFLGGGGERSSIVCDVQNNFSEESFVSRFYQQQSQDCASGIFFENGRERHFKHLLVAIVARRNNSYSRLESSRKNKHTISFFANAIYTKHHIYTSSVLPKKYTSSFAIKKPVWLCRRIYSRRRKIQTFDLNNN